MSKQPNTLASYEAVPKPPFAAGARVRVPRGTTVRSLNPARRAYQLTRAQVVKVNHVLSGVWVSVAMALGEYREQLEAEGFDLSELERWRTENREAYHRSLVQITEPAVCWAGTSGYWCEVPASLVESLGIESLHECTIPSSKPDFARA